jgi:hypothetical protein
MGAFPNDKATYFRMDSGIIGVRKYHKTAENAESPAPIPQAAGFWWHTEPMWRPAFMAQREIVDFRKLILCRLEPQLEKLFAHPPVAILEQESPWMLTYCRELLSKQLTR